jgi:hypothetical protein
MAMNAFVQLALIEKTKRVFAADAGIFLSFPLLSPISFKTDALPAMFAPSSSEGYAAAADFARIVNFVPRDIVASHFEDRYLWDVYADVLARAEVADATSAAGTGNVDAGYSTVLYQLNADGTRTESAIYRAYRQYRDAWFVAGEDYSARKLTGEDGDNPEAARHWAEVEEPALRAALAKAESDWKILGHRDEVEAALLAERNAAQQNPRQRWREWSYAFNPDIDLLTEPSGGRFAPTGVTPKDFATNTEWLRFDISAGEMAKLVNEAPAALKVVLDAAAGNNIDHVSFDYRSVAVVRPWFDSAALTSRIWRSSDPDLALSNGADPASGTCPGYVTAIVFIRNLQVTSRSDPSAPSGLRVTEQLRFTIPADRLVQRDLNVRATPPKVAQPTPTPPAAAQRAFANLEKKSVTAAPTLAAKPVVQRFAFEATAATRAAATLNVRMAEAVTPRRPVVLGPAPVPFRVKPAPPPVSAPAAPAPAPQQPAPSAPAAPAPPQSNDVVVLAFICKRLPKSPDPLPDLRWT